MNQQSGQQILGNQLPEQSQQRQQEVNISPNQRVLIDQVQFKPPTKNPEEIFLPNKGPDLGVQPPNQPDDNKSVTSQKSAQSHERKRKGSFIERMSEIQQSEEEKLNQKRKADLKAIFLENVDYKATKEQIELIFEDCAKIERITILKDPFTNHPKGCCYVSFESQLGVQRALNLSGVTLRNRQIKVHRKRTNLPGKHKTKNQDLSINLLGIMQNFNHPSRGRGRGRGR